MKSLASLLALGLLASTLTGCPTEDNCGLTRMVDPVSDTCVCRPGYTEVGDVCILDSELDGGPDAGTDTSVDVPGSDVMAEACTAPDDCPERDNATRTCDAMTCGFECDEDWGDCDGDPTNGCETDLTNTEANCGTCDNACEDDQLCFESSCEQEPMLDWARTFGEISTEQSYAIDIAPDGQLLVAGTYDDRTPFTLDDITIGEGAYFIAAFDSTGSLGFVLGDGGDGNMFPYGITADAMGNSYVVGSVSSGGVQFGPDAYSSAMGAAAIVSYEPDGSYRWSRVSDGAGTESFLDVDADESGFVVAVGRFDGSSTFGEFPARRVTSEGGTDALAVSYSSTGSVRWTERVGGPSNAGATSVAFTSDGSLVLGGNFADEISLGGVERTGAPIDGFVLGLSTSGSYQFNIVPVTSGAAIVHDIEVGADGSTYVAGWFIGNVNFGGDDLVSVSESVDAFIVKLSAEGDHVWSRRFGGTGNMYFEVNLAVSTDGVYVAGTFDGRIGLGSESILSGMDGTDGFVVAYDLSGTPRWIRALAGPNEDTIRAIDARNGVLAITGFYQESIEVGDTLNATGFQDVYLARYRVR